MTKNIPVIKTNDPSKTKLPVNLAIAQTFIQIYQHTNNIDHSYKSAMNHCMTKDNDIIRLNCVNQVIKEHKDLLQSLSKKETKEENIKTIKNAITKRNFINIPKKESGTKDKIFKKIQQQSDKKPKKSSNVGKYLESKNIANQEKFVKDNYNFEDSNNNLPKLKDPEKAKQLQDAKNNINQNNINQNNKSNNNCNFIIILIILTLIIFGLIIYFVFLEKKNTDIISSI